MTYKEIGWSQKRREASRFLAFFQESRGEIWKSIREAVPIAANVLKVDPIGKRSAVAIRCLEKMQEMGFVPPPNYIAPWVRGDRPMFQRGRRQADDRLLAFYDSWDWKRLRYDVLKARGRRCECCGASGMGVVIMVDHIKPIRKFWHLRLDPGNLQVLCEDCNKGKGSRDETDWRAAASAVPSP